MRHVVAAVVLCHFCRLAAQCEVSYQETTRITGGSITQMMSFASTFSKNARKLGQPVITTVAVKGNVMARDSQDFAEIINLDAQTITHIDKQKHGYTVTTFAQMREAMQRAIAKAQAEQSKAPAQNPSSPAQDADSKVQLNLQPTVRKTGVTRQISGLQTNEIILSLAMSGTDKKTGEQAGALGVTNDMWLASDIPAYQEVREFGRRLAIELGSSFRAAGAELTGMGGVGGIGGMAGQPQSEEALRAMAKEMSQIQGVPVLQVMRMGMTANGQPLPAASEAPLPTVASKSGPSDSLGAQVAAASETTARQTAAQEASQRLRGALGSGVGSAIGGFGGFGRKKKTATQTADTAASSSTPQPSATAAQPQSAVLVESTTEIGNFSQQADPALFQIPAGFQVTPTLK